jgi:hypothetical protein
VGTINHDLLYSPRRTVPLLLAEHSTAGRYTRNLAIDRSRLWDSQMDMANAGAIEKGGGLRRAVARYPDRCGGIT